MFDWYFHLLGLKSPCEMRAMDAQFRRDMRRIELALARAMAESLTGDLREKAMAQIAEAERKEEA